MKKLKEKANQTYEAFLKVINLIVEDFVMSMHSNFAVDKSVYSFYHFIKVLRVQLLKILHQNLRCSCLKCQLLLLLRMLLLGLLELLLSLSTNIPTHTPAHHMRRLLRLN